MLLLAFHIGRGVKHLDEWWGKQVSLDFLFNEAEEVKRHMAAAGFVPEGVTERDP